MRQTLPIRRKKNMKIFYRIEEPINADEPMNDVFHPHDRCKVTVGARIL